MAQTKEQAFALGQSIAGLSSLFSKENKVSNLQKDALNYQLPNSNTPAAASQVRTQKDLDAMKSMFFFNKIVDSADSAIQAMRDSKVSVKGRAEEKDVVGNKTIQSALEGTVADLMQKNNGLFDGDTRETISNIMNSDKLYKTAESAITFRNEYRKLDQNLKAAGGIVNSELIDQFHKVNNMGVAMVNDPDSDIGASVMRGYASLLSGIGDQISAVSTLANKVQTVSQRRAGFNGKPIGRDNAIDIAAIMSTAGDITPLIKDFHPEVQRNLLELRADPTGFVSRNSKNLAARKKEFRGRVVKEVNNLLKVTRRKMLQAIQTYLVQYLATAEPILLFRKSIIATAMNNVNNIYAAIDLNDGDMIGTPDGKYMAKVNGQVNVYTLQQLEAAGVSPTTVNNLNTVSGNNDSSVNVAQSEDNVNAVNPTPVAPEPEAAESSSTGFTGFFNGVVSDIDSLISQGVKKDPTLAKVVAGVEGAMNEIKRSLPLLVIPDEDISSLSSIAGEITRTIMGPLGSLGGEMIKNRDINPDNAEEKIALRGAKNAIEDFASIVKTLSGMKVGNNVKGSRTYKGNKVVNRVKQGRIDAAGRVQLSAFEAISSAAGTRYESRAIRGVKSLVKKYRFSNEAELNRLGRFFTWLADNNQAGELRSNPIDKYDRYIIDVDNKR